MKITVAGGGYVGLSLATLLAQKHEVIVLEINEYRAERITDLDSPIQDEYIEKYFDEAKQGKRKLNIRATTDYKDAIKDAEFVIIATPTNYDSQKNNRQPTNNHCR